jgi:phosphoserine phosphatase RsbU/P
MLSDNEKIAFIKEIRLFDDASENDIKKISDVAHEVHYSDGDNIIIEGDMGDSLYFVVHGKVNVQKSGMEFQLGVKACIGEIAMIDDQPRSASVISIGDTVLLRIDRDDFQRIIYGNARLIRSFLKVVSGKLRISTIREDKTMKEVVKAGEIQISILPKPKFLFPTEGAAILELSSTYSPHPSEKVSGDYYDYFPLSDHQMGIVIGDVMGHGTHAGMIVCMAKGCINTQIKSDWSIPKVMSAMNDIIFRFISAGLSDRNDLKHLFMTYMTFCYLIIDLQSHTVSYSNSAHCTPYHYSANTRNIHSLKSHTEPLGISDSLDHEVSQFRWNKGDVLVLYTDGLTEVENMKCKSFGDKRLKSLIKLNAHLSAEEIKNNIIEEINNHCQEIYCDDRSLIIVKM